MRHTIQIFLSAAAKQAASDSSFKVGLKNAKGQEPAEIVLIGEIGNPFDAADASSVVGFLRQNKGMPVNVRINSFGGLAYDGITIHNALAAHDGKVTTIVEGIAGSAASIIAMAGNPVQMYENADLFIHRASLVVAGNTDMMDEAKGWLDRLDDAIARTYKAKTKLSLDKIKAQMRGKVDGTVFTAKEALSDRYIDEILPLRGAKNSIGDTSYLREQAEKRHRDAELSRLQRIRTRRELFQ